MKFIDIPIGKTVKYHGKRGVCEESQGVHNPCRECILGYTLTPCYRLCSPQDRKDGKDVYFKEIKEQTDEQ